MWHSPNATLRNFLGGTIFREPIYCKNIPRLVPSWKKPVVVARHGTGDQYDAINQIIPKGARVELVIEQADGSRRQFHVDKFAHSDGVLMVMTNTDNVSGIPPPAHSIPCPQHFAP